MSASRVGAMFRCTTEPEALPASPAAAMDLAALARRFPGRVLVDGQSVPPPDPALATGQPEQAARRVLPAVR